jgi:chromosome condensin MukBEF ATPase and DNA-binding subunit MukB
MKLNPFSKKSNGYFDSVRSKHATATRELADIQHELDDAQAVYDQENTVYRKICDASGAYSMNATAKSSRQHEVLSKAHRAVEILKDKVGSIQSRLKPLEPILQAPDRLEKSRAELTALTGQRKSLEGQKQKTDALIDKLAKRIASNEAKVAIQTRDASQQMMDSEDEFQVPAALQQLELELRLAKTSMADLVQRKQDILAAIQALPKQIKEAESEFLFARSVVCEIEMYEQLWPIMKSLTRRALTRQVYMGSSNRRELEIDIPDEWMEPVQKELDAELAALN